MSNAAYSTNRTLQRAMAEVYASDYCKSHDLSLDRLRSQRFEIFNDRFVFAQPTGVEPDGLRNDIATRPFPTLVIRLDDQGKIIVEETEYTRKYLG